METSFLGGSENLYKYLVTIGLLLIVATIYYPLKEKQELELLKISLESDVKCLNFKANENQKNAKILKSIKQKTGHVENIELEKLIKINSENLLNDIETSKKLDQIRNRTTYIRLYNILFWVFLPLGVLFTACGFIKWWKIKRYDDDIKKLEKDKLQLQIQILKKESEA